MTFFGVLLIIAGIIVIVWWIYIVFRDLILPLYEEKYLQKKYAQDLFDKVRWMFIKNSLGCIGSHHTYKTVRDRDLIEYIFKAQYDLRIEDNYCIDYSNENERNFICEILEAHKQYEIEILFLDALKKDKLLFKLDFFEYYMFSLLCFLERNLLIDKFNGKKMYEAFRSDKNEITYIFTNSAILFHKLYLICNIYCKNCEKLNHFANFEHKILCEKKYLDNKKIVK